MDQLNIPVLLGTNRKERNSVFPAKWLIGEMEKRPEIKTRLFDVADFHLPHDDYGQGLKDQFPEWRDAIMQADDLDRRDGEAAGDQDAAVRRRRFSSSSRRLRAGLEGSVSRVERRDHAG